MSRWRVWLVSGFLVFLVAGHAWDAYFRDVHWPFSQYAMFRGVSTRAPLVRLSLYGVTADGRDVRIMGPTAGVMNYRWNSAIGPMYNRGRRERDVARTRDAMRALLAWYERARGKGDVDGPPIVGMRLVRQTWPFDERARNRHEPQTEVILEVTQPDAPPDVVGAPATSPENGGRA
jgi:hypothetical protein